MCGRLTHVVRRLNKCAYKNKVAYREASFFSEERGYFVIMEKVDESKKAELLSESSLFLFLKITIIRS